MKPPVARRRFVPAIVVSLAGALAVSVHAAHFGVPDDFADLQSAVDAAAAADLEPHFINLRVERLDTFAEVLIGDAFSAERPLTIRPDPAVAVLRRVTIASRNGNQPILRLENAGHVTIRDLDLLRHVPNDAHLVQLNGCADILLERCRLGSDWRSPGAGTWDNLVVHYPRQVVVRNCLFFSHVPGVFERGIVASIGDDARNSLLLYHNVVADARDIGIEISAPARDSLVLLRNNVVANRPGLAPEPTAFRSQVQAGAIVVSSHNAVFASDGRVESVAWDQAVAGGELLRLAPAAVDDAFVESLWRIDPEWHPNPQFFRLRENGPLHRAAASAGLIVADDLAHQLPHPRDVAVWDDWEEDPRPSGDPERVDRGADQYRPLLAGDLGITLPRLPPLHGLLLRGGGFEIVAVGPQTEPPPELDEEGMSGGGYSLRGGFGSLSLDVWRDWPGCAGGPLPLHIDRTDDDATSRIWNDLEGGELVWRYEGQPREYVLNGPNFPEGTRYTLERSQCSEHFQFYYTEQGADAVDRAYVDRMAGLLEAAWDTLFRAQGFRDLQSLQDEEDQRYGALAPFTRLPVMIFRYPTSDNNHASRAPWIQLIPDLGSGGWDPSRPLHELFHVMLYGYTHHSQAWINEALAAWAQQLKTDVPPRCVFTDHLPLLRSQIELGQTGAEYCDAAAWFDYLGRKYGQVEPGGAAPDGSDVVRAVLEELADVGEVDSNSAMQAIERALDRFSAARQTGFGHAFAEWAVGNYVNDTLSPPAQRPGTPAADEASAIGITSPGVGFHRWKQYRFQTDARGALAINLEGSARASGPDSENDDDLRLWLDGAPLADWDSAKTINGDALRGATATIQIFPQNVPAGEHLLEVESERQPTLHSIKVVQHATPSLEVKFFRLDPWSAHYHVVPVDSDLLDSEDERDLHFSALGWDDPRKPPFHDIIYLDAGGQLASPLGGRSRLLTATLPITHATLERTGERGRVVWVVAGADSGGTYELIRQSVPDANDAPVLAPIEDQLVAEGDTLSVRVSATDPDRPAQDLRFSLADGAPAGAEVDADSGRFQWTPAEGQAGTHAVTVRVEDDGWSSLSVSASFIVTVLPRPRIAAVTVVGDEIRLRWTTVAGKRYRFQFTDRLDQPQWLDVPGEFLGDGSIVEASAPIGPTGQRFYRLEQRD